MEDYIGESYKGISRNDHPEWSGWKEIDRHKEMRGFPDNLKFSDVLAKAVKDFQNKDLTNS